MLILIESRALENIQNLDVEMYVYQANDKILRISNYFRLLFH